MPLKLNKEGKVVDAKRSAAAKKGAKTRAMNAQRGGYMLNRAVPVGSGLLSGVGGVFGLGDIGQAIDDAVGNVTYQAVLPYAGHAAATKAANLGKVGTTSLGKKLGKEIRLQLGGAQKKAPKRKPAKKKGGATLAAQLGGRMTGRGLMLPGR